MDNYDCVKTLKEHSKSVNSIKLIEENLLVSCSDDHTLKIWDLDEGKCIRTLEGGLFYFIYKTQMQHIHFILFLFELNIY